jgi:hypothetical protein
MNFNKTISSGGILKRLKDASISDCNTLMTNSVDLSSCGELTFSFNPIGPGISTNIHDKTNSLFEMWNRIVEKFEEKYTQIYIQSDMKKKAHLDCIEEGSNLIHEPKAKWCHVLLLDALVHSAHNYVFSALVESSVRRRKFNQHLELRNSILEVYGKSTTENVSFHVGSVSPEAFDRTSRFSVVIPNLNDGQYHTRPHSNVITPELVDRDLTPLYPASSPSNVADISSLMKKNKKRKLSPHLINGKNASEKDKAEDENLLENILSLLSESPHSSSEGPQSSHIENRGVKKALKTLPSSLTIDPASTSMGRRPTQWDTHDNFRDYLLSLAGTDKSSKRFQTVVYDLCSKLSADKSVTNYDRQIIKTESSTRTSPSSSPRSLSQSPSDLMAIIAAVITKVCSSPDVCPNDEESHLEVVNALIPPLLEPLSPSNSPALPDFDFYKIESELNHDNEFNITYNTNTSESLSDFLVNPPNHEFVRMVTVDDKDIKQEPDEGAGKTLTIIDLQDTARSLYIIPSDQSEGPESSVDESDNDESCVMAEEEECEGTARAFSLLFQIAEDGGDYLQSAQNSNFASFNEVWDDFSLIPNYL